MLPRYSFGAGESWKNVNRLAPGTFSSAAVTVKYWSLASMRMAALPAPRREIGYQQTAGQSHLPRLQSSPLLLLDREHGLGRGGRASPVPFSFRERREPSSPTISVAQRVS